MNMVVWCDFNVNVEWKVENGKVRMEGAERSYQLKGKPLPNKVTQP